MPASEPPSPNLPRLSPTDLSQYIRLENCDRFLRFRLVEADEQRLRRKWNLTIQPLSPLLKESGTAFERSIAERLAHQGEPVINLDGARTEETLRRMAEAHEPVILLQPSLEARLGDYWCSGRADAVRLWRNSDEQLQVLIADIKATRHERAEHRLQVAVYAHLLESMAQEGQLPLGQIEGAILTIAGDGGLPPLDLETPTFDLDTYRVVLGRMIQGPDSVAARVTEAPFEDVFYHLSYKCDGCLYNALCMWDSAERMDITLTPYISAVEKRVLNEAGITRLPQLAGLMDLPPDGGRELTPASGQEEVVSELRSRWPVAANLPFLVQRARKALKRFDHASVSRTFLYGSGFGALPADEDHPGLVKVFFDAQHDYLLDRVYLISGLVRGPQGERVIVNCTSEPPSEAAESELLLGWIQAVIEAAGAVSGKSEIGAEGPGAEAPIHLYCYNRYDQKVLLEALKRHLDVLGSIPAFFDLLTQSPALSQPVISFLAEEVQERKNLGMVCAPLHDVARSLKFDWQDEHGAYYQLFRARIFDNRRDVVRTSTGDLLPAPGGIERGDPRRITIESASRFNSQIPLEYAYAAWGCLPDLKEDQHLLDPFRRVTLEQLKAFAALRVRALAHIEASFARKARGMQKPPLRLPASGQPEEPGDLRRSLEEFLFIEHHAVLQTALLAYSLPVDRRVQTGEALLLEAVGKDAAGLYRFRPQFTALGLDPDLTLSACRLKEGDWVVLNELNGELSPNAMKHGRLAVIAAIGQHEVTLDLLGATFPRDTFRYRHNNRLEPETGKLYTLDSMADDLNADKTLQALRQAGSNTLFHWLLGAPAPRDVPPEVETFFRRFADQVDALLGQRRMRLTKRQREVISGELDAPLLLVQGPPGTGKSYTLAWAILARLAALAAAGQPARIVVACKTHNAVNVVLKALAEAKRSLGGFALPQLGGEGVRGMMVCKVVNGPEDAVPPGVQRLDPRTMDVGPVLRYRWVVFGATSGGLYNLMRYSAPDGKTVNWEQKTFDLAVVDEASQMSVPEGLLSCAFLKPDGSVIVVGDHRQMAPITAHPWKDEQKRSITRSRPYLSLFEFLAERGFPRLALDESFRLHELIARFLHENIYVRDGIHFHSRRKETLHQMPRLNPYVDAALNPAYPIVVIEHTEAGSQQSNRLELDLARPLIEACVRYLGLDGRTGIGVVVPHRAQRALLREEFPALAEVNSIDTVERFQGDERDVILVSATASDPDFVRAEADFLLNLNRLNVAISRPRKKLIVIAARSVIDLLVSDLDVFENAVIWKRLYYHYAPDILYQDRRNGWQVIMKGRRA